MAIDLYLIRHADAAPAGTDGPADEERPLSDEGKTQCAALAAALQRSGAKFDLLVTSPLVRARQTAEALLEHWNGDRPELRECGALKPDAKRKKLKRLLLSLEGAAVGLIGHQPDLGKLAAWLIGGKRAEIELAKAGFAKIECPELPDKGAGTLTLLVTPKGFGG